MRVGIKYCGGCNPRYDRVAFVERLKAGYPGEVFSYARLGEHYDLLLVVCGCTAQCPDISSLRADQIRYICSDGPFQL